MAALDISAAREVKPGEPEVTASEGGPAAMSRQIEDAKSTTPPSSAGVRAFMSEVAAAGIDLSRLVLAILTGSILVLLGYLIWMEYYVGSDLAPAYSRIVNPNKIGSEVYVLSRMERMLDDFSALKSDKDAVLSDDAKKNVASVAAFVEKLASVPIDAKNKLKSCGALPTGEARNPAVDACIATVGAIRQAAIEASSSVTDGQIVSEFASKLIDERNAFHAFWLQASQMILLNLLLPLLTALFGYVFGTQQAKT